VQATLRGSESLSPAGFAPYAIPKAYMKFRPDQDVHLKRAHYETCEAFQHGGMGGCATA
jgi:hypothetical protein